MNFSIKAIVLFVCCITMVINVKAQRLQKKNTHSSAHNNFLEKQWWIGIHGGFNLAKANPVERYSVFSPMNNAPEYYHKSYQDYKHAGMVTGLEFTFSYQHFSASFQPGYKRTRFTYDNSYTWSDGEGVLLELDYSQYHQVDYFNFPLFVKYDVLMGHFRPFLLAGGFYASMNNAYKTLDLSGLDRASGGNEYNNPPITSGVQNLFIRSWFGYVAGAGVSWDIGNLRLVLDLTYRHGTNVITNRANRYTENQMAGAGDALDDIKLRTMSVSMGCLFPLRFLNTGKYVAHDK